MKKKLQRDPDLNVVLDHIRTLSPSLIETKTGVSPSTIRAWRSGKTRRPQNITIEYALKAAGFRRIIVADK